jgi:NAD(P)-dependent dehydrogenase (short-subunit alcohol dehydrogenase family)
MGQLRGKIALITGASRGLGNAIALRFAREGASIGLVARGAVELELVIPELDAAKILADQQFRAIPADLASEHEIERVVDICLREFGGIDILVNNAAVQGPIGSLEENDWHQWQSTFAVNLFAPARLCQLLVPIMRNRGGGKIINISGGGATGPRPDFSAYAASKTGLVRLTETLAEELRVDRIDVNAVAPGAMNTRMLDELLAAGPDAASREFAEAVKRKNENAGASPGRAAGLVAMFASAKCDGITGKLISAVWDDWESLPDRREELMTTDIYTLRRVTPINREAR